MISVSGKRTVYFAVGVLTIVSLVGSLLPARNALAAQITNRSLTLQDGTDPGSKPSGVVNHLFTFTLPSGGGAIHSIKFQYCTTADIDTGGACTKPTGLTTTSAALGTVTGQATAVDGIANTTNGAPYVTSTAGFAGDGSTSSSVQLTTVTNQDSTNCGGTNNCTFFVRITTYTGSDGATGPVDSGTVAASTSTQIVLTGTMPESLIFCTGGTVNVNGSGIPDCSTATSGDITFPMLFSPTATAYTTSQMAASTNALSGYAITVSGPTLTSGGNTVTAVGTTPTVSNIGTGQFGINLVANTTPTVGTNVSPAPDGTSHMGKAKTNFGTADSFTYNASGLNTVAASDNGTGTGAPTDSQIFTSSYIVNVPGRQPAGTYTTTLTYICTPTF